MGEMLQRSVDKITKTISADPTAAREALGVPSEEQLSQMNDELEQREQQQESTLSDHAEKLNTLESRVAALENQSQNLDAQNA